MIHTFLKKISNNNDNNDYSGTFSSPKYIQIEIAMV